MDKALKEAAEGATPRTDAVLDHAADAYPGTTEYQRLHCYRTKADGLSDLARTLERTLTATQAELAKARENERRYLWLRDRSRREDREGGWTGMYTTFPTPAWDDTPYSKERGQGYHYETMDDAIDAAIAAQKGG